MLPVHFVPLFKRTDIVWFCANPDVELGPFTGFHNKANHTKHIMKICGSWSKVTYSASIYFEKQPSLPLCLNSEFSSPYCQPRFLSFYPSCVQSFWVLYYSPGIYSLPLSSSSFPLNLHMPFSSLLQRAVQSKLLFLNVAMAKQQAKNLPDKRPTAF